MEKFCWAIIIFAIAIIIAPQYEAVDWPDSWYTHITVQNNLSDETVTLHCQSKDDDLGEVKVEANQSFTFRFTPNIFESTLYWCDVWSKLGHVSSSVFSEKDEFYKYCNFKDCTWTISDQGINVLDLNTTSPVLWHKWNEN
ncbi:S-protein-like protein 1 [Bienertia sinuspersici]